MSLRTWWLETQLGRADRKLKKLRTRQKLLREDEAELAKERKKGLSEAEANARAEKIRAAREATTAELNRVLADADRLKDALRAEGVTVATH